MFRQARIKLTLEYLAIIMVISLSFSFVIFLGVNRELTRIERAQELRVERNQEVVPLFEEFRRERALRGAPVPTLEILTPEIENISGVRARIILTLGIINLTIFVVSGLGGYFLAGETLRPISEMLEEQKGFIGNASHELRTPLTSLKSEIEVALRNKKMTTREARALLKSNLEEVDKMHKLSDYLLRLNRYQSGAPLPLTTLNLKNVIAKAIKIADSLAKAKRIKIIAKLQNAKIKGNEDSLVEIATILIDNAIKYSPRGGKVIVTTKKAKGGATLEVTDFGAGIKKEDLPHIFERFYRADSARNKEKTNGYGLGLSIAKSIAEEVHHGKISVESTFQKGSKFTVRFS